MHIPIIFSDAFSFSLALNHTTEASYHYWWILNYREREEWTRSKENQKRAGLEVTW